MENLILAFITIIATSAITLTIGAVFHWLNTRTITLNAMTVTKELRIDLDKILQTIVTDGEQTRRAIRESGEWAIKAIQESGEQTRRAIRESGEWAIKTIQESHRVVKEELRK